MDQATLHAIYLACLIIGGGFLLITAHLGGDHNFHGDIGDLGHDIFGPFLESHGVHIDPDNHDSINPLNLRSLMAFLAAFGAVGYFTSLSGLAQLVVVVLSILAGLVSSVSAWGLLVFLVSQQSDSMAKNSDFLALPAEVTLRIPENGLGEITAVVKGQHRTLLARSYTGGVFQKGEKVFTLSYEGGVVAVGRELDELVRSIPTRRLKEDGNAHPR